MPVLALRDSKSGTARLADVQLKKSQFCSRLKNCRLAITNGRSEKSKCDLCMSWQGKAQKIVEHLYQDANLSLSASLNSYWEGFDASAVWDGELIRSESVEYLDYMVEWVAGHGLKFPAARAMLDEQDRLQLEIAEHGFLEDLRAVRDQVGVIGFHRSLIRTVLFRWQWCLKHISSKVITVVWDHMSAVTLPRGPKETQKSWYANARLGVHVCCIKVFGGTFGRPVSFMYVSKCKEKGALYSLAIFRDLMGRVDVAG